MTVKQLIKLLKEYPKDAIVAVDANNGRGSQIVGAVEDQYFHESGCVYLWADTSKYKGEPMIGFTE